MTTQPRQRNQVILEKTGSQRLQSNIRSQLESKRNKFKEQLLQALVSPQTSARSQCETQFYNYENINWQEPSDNDLLYLMQMQASGLDAQGDQIAQPNKSLQNLVNIYLKRQDLAPAHYRLRNLNEKEIK